MPYTKAQLALFGMALSMQRGDTPYSDSPKVAKIARTTPQSDLKRMIKEGVKKKK